MFGVFWRVSGRYRIGGWWVAEVLAAPPLVPTRGFGVVLNPWTYATLIVRPDSDASGYRRRFIFF